MQREVDRGVQTVDAEPVDGQHLATGGALRLLALGQAAVEHGADEVVGLGPVGVDDLDDDPVPHDGDAVGEGGDLLEPVRDVQDGAALVAQQPGGGVQLRDLEVVEDGGDLVEDDQPRSLGLHAQHLGEGLAGRVELTQRALEVEVEPGAPEDLHAAHQLLLPRRLRERGVPQHVLDDGHVRRDREVLLDDAHARVARLRRALRRVRRPVEQHGALARRQLAADRLDERRLARPVASDEPDDLGPPDGEVESAQDVAEPAVLVQPADLQQRARVQLRGRFRHRLVAPRRPECLAGTPSPGPARRRV